MIPEATIICATIYVVKAFLITELVYIDAQAKPPVCYTEWSLQMHVWTGQWDLVTLVSDKCSITRRWISAYETDIHYWSSQKVDQCLWNTYIIGHLSKGMNGAGPDHLSSASCFHVPDRHLIVPTDSRYERWGVSGMGTQLIDMVHMGCSKGLTEHWNKFMDTKGVVESTLCVHVVLRLQCPWCCQCRMGSWNLISQITWYPRLVPTATQFSNGSTAIERTSPGQRMGERQRMELNQEWKGRWRGSESEKVESTAN